MVAMPNCNKCSRQTNSGRLCRDCARDQYWEGVSAGDVEHPIESMDAADGGEE